MACFKSSRSAFSAWRNNLRFTVDRAIEAHAHAVTATLHPARAHIHAQRSAGEWAADSLTAAAGSWAFVFVHVVWFTIWLVLRLDINLLTLIVSLEAIFLATFVLMSQNRAGARDRTRDDTEAMEVDQMLELNRRQLLILDAQNVILDVLKAQHVHVATANGSTPATDGPSDAPNASADPRTTSKRIRIRHTLPESPPSADVAHPAY